MPAPPHNNMASSVTWLVLRRLRTPLLVLVSTYAISVFGLVLIPSVDPEGNAFRMDFLHAIYFVSYMATTIGFGELPHAFSPAQRLWVTLCIYLTVTAWLYSIGAILTLLRDDALRQAIIHRRFARRVGRIAEPFYLVCGYGEAGARLASYLTDYYIPVVVIDKDPARVAELALDDQRYRVFVPGLCADASDAAALRAGGLLHPQCRRIIAITGDDTANLKIAITAKLLDKRAKVIARTEHHDVAANMDSFGTEHIFDPFDTFADTLALAWRAPASYRLQHWLSGQPGQSVSLPKLPPRGRWVLCGHGRFGMRLWERLHTIGMQTTVIELNEDIPCPPETVHGRGTEADTLIAANITEAVGIVAGTDDDVNNLSIIMTARELNPNLFVVARQNLARNLELFDAVEADLVMNPRHVLAVTLSMLITAPMLRDFLARAARTDAEQIEPLTAQLGKRFGERMVPDVWTVTLDAAQAGAVTWALGLAETTLTLDSILRDPYDAALYLPAQALMLRRDGQDTVDPSPAERLREGDKLLFCGRRSAYLKMRVALKNHFALYRMITGKSLPRSLLFRWLRRGERLPELP